MNLQRYVEALGRLLVPTLKNFFDCNQITWFPHDRATSDASNMSLSRVRQILPGKLKSRRGVINWLQRGPDLAPMGIFLWAYTFLIEPLNE